MLSKEFLLHELQNVQRALDDTLRHDYLPGDGSEFYVECQSRLAGLGRRLARAHPDDLKSIGSYAAELSVLSRLVSLIERSHIGEFSWAFASRLRELTREVCSEPEPGTDQLVYPIVHVLAEGGLTSYAIYHENPVETGGLQRIVHVKFPRTLKHDVLLHAILGHEIGHAALAIPHRLDELRREVITPLFATGPLETQDSAEIWLNRPDRAPVANAYLKEWNAAKTHPFSFTGANNAVLKSWQREFFCDLFGLVMFGPSFACAHRLLLQIMAPSGEDLTEYHPPYASRALLLLKVLNHLKWLDFDTQADDYLEKATTKLREYVEKAAGVHPWFDVFTDDQVRSATDGLLGVLSQHSSAIYTQLPGDVLNLVKRCLSEKIPPTGASIDRTEEEVHLGDLDFRHVLTAGWIYWMGIEDVAAEDRLTFGQVNQLCDRGILQQRAVEIAREASHGGA